VNEIIVLAGLILAAAAGYGARALLAKLEDIPADLEQVVIGFNRCDRCEFGDDHDASAAYLGEALLAAAGSRGISRGQLLGFIARATVPAVPVVLAEAASAPAVHLTLVEERPAPRRATRFGGWPREAEVLEVPA
jgi:hypothetical protein